MMEGLWHEGIYMPGCLYFYITFGKIEVAKDKHISANKIIGSPWLRDLEWIKAYTYMEARGFSGFELDEEYTCYRPAKEFWELEVEDRAEFLKDNYFPAQTLNNGIPKKYIKATEYLWKQHTSNLGKPLMQNAAKNVSDCECRGGGKSFFAADAMALNNWLTDGCYDFDAYVEAKKIKNPFKTDTLICAVDTKYTTPLLDKLMLCYTEMEGSVEFQGKYYPPPIRKKMEGTWYSGKQFVTNRYRVKSGNSWKWKGSGSKIYHRTFKDNPQAVNGLRVSLGLIEESGFADNLLEVLDCFKDTTYDGSHKFGTVWAFGTGGQMQKGVTEQFMEMFLNGEEHDCLVFEDIYEENKSIGLFVPYHMGLNQFKDDDGVTDVERSKKWVEKKREKYRKMKNKSKWYNELQNNPEKPSEAFLIGTNNIFPIAELKEHLNWVKSKSETDIFVRGFKGELVWVNSEDKFLKKVKWKPDLDNELTPCKFRHKRSDDTTGCIQIWEQPITVDGEVPVGLYIAGLDPYAQDNASTASLGSCIIYKVFSTHDGVHELPVAEYTARPKTAKQYYENVEKLLVYYNAKCLYENNINNFKAFCQNRASLNLLEKTPSILKSTMNSSVTRQYGIHMTASIKEELEIYVRDWLIQEDQEGRLNLHKIYSVPLLEELIYYNGEINTDRVIALMLVVLLRHQRRQDKLEIIKPKKKLDPFFQRQKQGKFYV